MTGNETLRSANLLSDKIRKRFISELGITASVGIANNKIMAKLGSDYKKPNASTLITPDDYEHMVWPLPASDLLYVGPSTTQKLAKVGIMTIGDIARSAPQTMHMLLGKNGEMIHSFGNQPPVRSIGIRGCNLVPDMGMTQMSIIPEDSRRAKLEIMESTMDKLRARYGHFANQRASMLADPIGQINPKDDHTIHPVSYTMS